MYVPDDGDGDGLADDVGDEPDEQLEGGGAEDEPHDGAFFAEFVGRAVVISLGQLLSFRGGGATGAPRHYCLGASDLF